ncbi:MAG: hypothetical protein ACR2G3_01300 [Solirubrobacterales bacterium]
MSRTEGERGPTGSPPNEAEAELAVARMAEMSVDMRACAVLDAAGGELASSGGSGWARAGAAFLAAADGAGEEAASQVHVATEDGEAFAVREGGLAMVAVAERFTLASLMLFDMRMVLRDLASGDGVPDRRAPGPEPEAA